MKSLIIFLFLISNLFAIIGINDIPLYTHYEGKIWSDKSLKYLRDNRLFNEVPSFLYDLASNEGEKMVWEDKLYIGTGFISTDNSNNLGSIFGYKRALLVYNTYYDLNCSVTENINWNGPSNSPTCKCSIELLNETNVNCLKYDYDTCSCSCDSLENDYVNINGEYQCLPKCEDGKIRDTNGICVKSSDFLKRPDYCKSYSGSYVIPYTHSFHDEKPITGSNLLLHYTNIYTNGFTNIDENITIENNTTKDILALGWDIDVHHHLSENTLFRGDGEYIKDVNTTLINGYISIKDKDLVYVFDESKKHIKTKNILSNTTLYEFYYSNGKLSSIKDVNSKSIFINYTSGKLSSIVTDSGQITNINTSSNNTITSITYPNNQTYTFTYDTNGLMGKKFDPKGNEYKYRYGTSDGFIRAVIRPQKGYMTYASSSSGNHQKGSILGFKENGKYLATNYKNYIASNGIKRSTVTYPSGYEKDVFINVNGKKRKTNFCGIETIEKYEAIHPKTNKPLLTSYSSKMPSGLSLNQTIHTSFVNNIQTQTKTVNNSSSTIKTDFSNHTKEITSPLGFTTKYIYDSKMLHVKSTKPPFSLPFMYEYDTKGNLIKQTRGERDQHYTYDSHDNLISFNTDENDTITYGYDSSNRLTSITYPDNSKVSFEYDLNTVYIPLILKCIYVFSSGLSSELQTYNNYQLDVTTLMSHTF